MARTPDRTPDCLFPSDPLNGIPILDPSLQALQFGLPFTAWGSVARRGRMRGTWHFYCDDYKFTTIWQTPTLVTNTRCVAVVEPNYSVPEQVEFPFALWSIYRKRWLARWWQSQGVPVLVDLNVSRRWERLNLQGVPSGWRAFATRASDHDLAELARHLELARGVAGTGAITFAVYGGGASVRHYCAAEGLLHFPDQGNARRAGGLTSNRQRN